MRLSLLTLLALPFLTAASSAVKPRQGFGTIKTTIEGSVVRASISNPPINFQPAKILPLLRSSYLKVQFFIAHLDLNSLLPNASPETAAIPSLYIDTVHLLKNITTTVFIGEIAGQAFGAGNELLVQMDMRFAGPGTRIGSLEVGIGLTHGNGGIQFLNNLIGRGRAAEYLFSSGDIDGPTAASIGWVNRYYDSKDALHTSVDALAQRIATFPRGALNATKAGLNEAGPSQEALDADLARFLNLVPTPEAQTVMARILEASENQTRGSFEAGLTGNLVDLYL